MDCRDYTYDRGKEIDVRLYIPGRNLIVDCRKDVKYINKVQGKYLSKLSKDDLRYASVIVSNLIRSNTMNRLIDQKTVQKFELDLKIDSAYYDIIYENESSGNKFINLPNTIVPILDLNKKSDLEIFVGGKDYPVAQKTIPKNSLANSGDLIRKLTLLTNSQIAFNSYVVSVEGKSIELLPDTGAA